MSGDSFRLYGTEMQGPEARVLTAGALSVTLQDGNLRTLRFKGHEVLRAVAFLVRDKDWGTCNASITGLSVRAEDHCFTINYVARFTAPSGANLDCQVSILGTPDGLNFSADCIADAEFETARAGFAVLHPVVGVAGQPVTVEHADGTIEHARWPDRIDPWQPFKEIAAITHRVANGVEATTRFEGDVLEMEDQRNWTDGSYKTYVRPLALPWPYMLEKDKAFSQRISVAIKADKNATLAPDAGDAISIRILPTTLTLPEIGIGLRPECIDQDRAAIEILKATGARHLIAHFDPLAGHGMDALKGYAAIGRESGLKITLELAVPCVRPLKEEFADIAALVRQSGLTLDSLFVSPAVDRQSTPPGSKWPACPPLEDVYAAAHEAFPGVRLGGGMLSYFTELNRKRAPGELVDYVSHCTNPIVHAADDLSVMQTFEALRHVIASTRAIYGDKPYRIGPSTIAMRQNPYGSATKDNPSGARIPMANTDPRHNGQFGAAWTLAYAATVAKAGLEVLTLSTLTGPFGLVAGANEPVAAGELRPLAQVIALLGALSGEDYHAVETSRPDAVLGLGVPGRLLLANITPQSQRVALPMKAREIRGLSAEPRKMPATDILELGAYECAEVIFDPA
jgi:D-apionolactonase